MRNYTALFVIDPAKEKSLQEIAERITGGITQNNGKINKEENWGKQRIPHAIKKRAEGIFYKLDFSIDPSHIASLNNGYKLNADILRVMITVCK